MPVATDTPAPPADAAIRIVVPTHPPDFSIDAARVLLRIIERSRDTLVFAGESAG
jgi:hypothetical protein